MPICFVVEPFSCALAASLLSSAWMMSGLGPMQVWLEQVRIYNRDATSLPTRLCLTSQYRAVLGFLNERVGRCQEAGGNLRMPCR